MKTRRNTVMLVGGAVYAVLIALAAFLLVRGFSRFADSERARDELRNQLVELHRANPFPSDQNVARERESVKQLETTLTNLLTLLQRGQHRQADPSPATFMTVLSSKRNELVQMAAKTGTILAPELDFSMARYLADRATMPAPEHVPRLTQQLQAAEHIAAILFEERVSELKSVRRDEFERAEGPGAPAPSSPRPTQKRPPAGRGAAAAFDPFELFETLRFTFEFKAKEKSLMGVLNRIAADDSFMVVRRLEISKEVPDVRPAPGALGADEDEEPAANPQREADPRKLRRSERMLSGMPLEHPAKIVMEVEVYRFRGVGSAP
jgi:hypothetical protein